MTDPNQHMKKFAAFALCLAAAWLLFGILAEAFIAWYSGMEYEIGARAWITVAVQALVNLTAIGLAWRVVRSKSSSSTS